MKRSGHSWKSSHSLTLTSRSYKHYLVISVILHLLYLNKCSLRNIKITQITCSCNDISHRSSLDYNFSSIFVRIMNNLSYTVNIGCKCCNNNSAVPVIIKDTVKCTSYCSFRHRISRLHYISTVTHKCQYALFTNFSYTLKIYCFTKYRRIINLKISRMEYNSCRSCNCKGSSICNTMISSYKFNSEISKIN